MKLTELDFSEFPPGTVTEYSTLVCLACIFDIFTKQIGLAPRSAYSDIKRYSPTVEEPEQFAIVEQESDRRADSLIGWTRCALRSIRTTPVGCSRPQKRFWNAKNRNRIGPRC
jgi:hypothetical protein